MTWLPETFVCGVEDPEKISPQTYQSAYHEAVTLLQQAGVEHPAQEAMWLLEAGLGISRLSVYAKPNVPVPAGAWTSTLALLHRRVGHEPLQYILGSQEFRGLSFAVRKGVFIPRPETELLVDEVVGHYQESGPVYLADIGTGSGCLGISMAKEIPGSFVFAIDRSALVLETAKHNAIRHSVGDRMRFLEGDLAEPLFSKGLTEAIDCIVSNPPYIPTSTLSNLPSTIRDFEPVTALDGGIEGLDFYRRLLRETTTLLKPGGRLVMELGEGQETPVRAMVMEQNDYQVCRVQKDQAGISRILCLQRK